MRAGSVFPQQVSPQAQLQVTGPDYSRQAGDASKVCDWQGMDMECARAIDASKARSRY